MVELAIIFRDFAKSANNNARVHKFAQNLKGARTMAWSKFHADDPQLLDAIVQNLVATSSLQKSRFSVCSSCLLRNPKLSWAQRSHKSL
jgi:hypothetical protein